MRRLAVLAVLVIAGIVPASASAQVIDLGDPDDCVEAVPAKLALTFAPVTVSVHVVLDGVSVARGQAVVEVARRAYAPLGISLNASFQQFAFEGSTETTALLAQTKSLFGGAQPADVVYTLTSKNLTAGGQSSVAGQADCIGGVAIPGRAFAVGEDADLFFPEETALGLRFFAELAGKTLAHEIGHLLGAHHHYANCAETVPAAVAEVVGEAEGRAEPCTLMFNDLSLQRLQFSALEAITVSGHAQAYAGQ